MQQPVKVLYFVDRMLRGGIQSLVIDWVSRFDKSKIHVDFLLLDDGKKYELEDTLKDLGCNVYKLKGIWINTPLDFVREAKALDSFFKDHHDYKVVHLHSSSKNYLVLKYAKKYDINMRIAHSHSTNFMTNNGLKRIVGNYLKNGLRKYSTHYFACSNDTGKWLFGNKILANDRFRVIHNSIDINNFSLNMEKRKIVRKELNYEESDIVIGHIGRFIKLKNHIFLVNLLKELNQNNNRYKLLLIGTGELECEIKQKVKELGLEEYVCFLGFTNKVYEFVQAMDIFILPSYYEGFPVSVVEAQASGLPCFISDVVTKEVMINDNVFFLSLNKPIEYWCNEIRKCSLKREDKSIILKKMKYDINDIAKSLELFYLKGDINEI